MLLSTLSQLNQTVLEFQQVRKLISKPNYFVYLPIIIPFAETTPICRFIMQPPILLETDDDDNLHTSIATSDLNGDHRFDIVYTNTVKSTIGILIGYSNGSFDNHETYSVESGLFAVYVQVADLNNDQKLDIVCNNIVSGDLSLFLGNGNGSFTSPISINIDDASMPSSFTIGDLNNDSYLDLAISRLGSSDIVFYLSDGQENLMFDKRFFINVTVAPVAVSLNDFNGDKILDIIYTSFNDEIGIFIGNGDGTFLPKKSFHTGSGSKSGIITTGDLNHDERVDVVVTDGGNRAVVVLLGNGDGTLGNLTVYPSVDEDVIETVVLEYWNNDIHLDIVSLYSVNGYISIHFGIGDGTFQEPLIIASEGSLRGVGLALGDFNDDNCSDLTVTYINEKYLTIYQNKR